MNTRIRSSISWERIKENLLKIDNKKELLEEVKSQFTAKEEALDAKKKELTEIVAETEKEEKILLEESEKASKSIDDRLLRAYKRIRGASKNGLAVVPVERGASGGSFTRYHLKYNWILLLEKRL